MRDSDPYRFIWEAIQYDNFYQVSSLLAEGLSSDVIDKVDADGDTLLHLATKLNRYEIVKLLIDAKASLNVLDKEGVTPLLLAFERQHYLVAELLADAGACVDPEYEAEHANELRLWTAVLRGDLDELCRRIDAGDSVDQAPHGGKANGWTALWLAMRLERDDAACMLAEAGANVDATDHLGQVPLHIAIDNHNLEMVEALIDAHANVDATDNNHFTPLHKAVIQCNLEVSKLLVEAGANVQALDNILYTPIYYLLRTMRVQVTPTSFREMFTLLTDAGATVDGATAKISLYIPSDVIRAIVPEDTPFWLAANNDAPMLAAELAGGLDPNMKTENGMTLLHWACAGDAPECVLLLLDAGAEMDDGKSNGHLDIHIEDERMLVPIFYCMHESSECLESIASRIADVNLSSSLRYAIFPIHLALAANSPACVTALVGAGAWVTMKEMHNIRTFAPLQLSLLMNPIPVDALRALLAAAGERVLSEKIGGMPPLYWIARYSTLDMRMLVEAGADVNEKYEDDNHNTHDSVLKFLEYSLSEGQVTPSEVTRLTAVIDYLKTLPPITKEQ